MKIKRLVQSCILSLTLLSAGAFNLVFYAAFSLNIPRYQMTALPSVAIGVGYMATRFAAGARNRKLPT